MTLPVEVSIPTYDTEEYNFTKEGERLTLTTKGSASEYHVRLTIPNKCEIVVILEDLQKACKVIENALG